MEDFNKEDLKFFLPEEFKGLSKKYILDCIFNEDIQKEWKPKIGDIIVGKTGNIFVISESHNTIKKLGGTKFFFGGGLCSRDGSNILNETYCNVLNEDGFNYIYTSDGIKKINDLYYSKFSDFKYVPYPHEL